MRKIKFAIFLLIVTVLAFWFGKQSSQTFEYVLLRDRGLLQKLSIDEVYINHIKNSDNDAIPFNSYQTYEFLTDKHQTAYFLPTQNHDKIQLIVECIENAEATHNDGKLDDILFFRDGHRIYYMYIGWDAESFYGKNWQSEAFIEILNKWKQDLLEKYDSMLKQEELEIPKSMHENAK
jgi:hypothetical protein